MSFSCWTPFAQVNAAAKDKVLAVCSYWLKLGLLLRVKHEDFDQESVGVWAPIQS